jgi:hypothetical protein
MIEKACKGMKNSCMFPQKGRNVCECTQRQRNEQFTANHVSPPKSKHEHKRPQQEKEFMHDSPKKAQMNVKACNGMKNLLMSPKKMAEMNVKACNEMKIVRHGIANGEKNQNKEKRGN